MRDCAIRNYGKLITSWVTCIKIRVFFSCYEAYGQEMEIPQHIRRPCRRQRNSRRMVRLSNSAGRIFMGTARHQKMLSLRDLRGSAAPGGTACGRVALPAGGRPDRRSRPAAGAHPTDAGRMTGRNAAGVSPTLQAFSKRRAPAATLPYVRQRSRLRQALRKRCRRSAVCCRRSRNAAGVSRFTAGVLKTLQALQIGRAHV